MKILGIDLGKYMSAACLLDTDTNQTLYFTFYSLPQSSNLFWLKLNLHWW
jgi:hypothetical protein